MLVLRGAFRPRKEAAVIGVKRNLVTTPAKPGSYQPMVARRSITDDCCRYHYKPEYFISMLSLNICTKQTIEKIISFADETDNLSLKAYALDTLNRMDIKTDFKI